MTVMAYRMGLAQACKQTRMECHPVYVRNAAVSVCSGDLDAFLAAFYGLNTLWSQGIRHLHICICHELEPRKLFDVLPLLAIQTAIPSIEFLFHANAACVGADDYFGRSQDWDEVCAALTSFCKMTDPSWLDELKKGTFKRIDMYYLVHQGHRDVGLELANGLVKYNRPAMVKLRSMLRPLPFEFCLMEKLVSGTEDEGTATYDHIEPLA